MFVDCSHKACPKRERGRIKTLPRRTWLNSELFLRWSLVINNKGRLCLAFIFRFCIFPNSRRCLLVLGFVLLATLPACLDDGLSLSSLLSPLSPWFVLSDFPLYEIYRTLAPLSHQSRSAHFSLSLHKSPLRINDTLLLTKRHRPPFLAIPQRQSCNYAYTLYPLHLLPSLHLPTITTIDFLA